MKSVLKLLAAAAAGCGLLCLPAAEGVLLSLGLGGAAAFVCDWEQPLLVTFAVLFAAAMLSALALAWRARTRKASAGCSNCETSET